MIKKLIVAAVVGGLAVAAVKCTKMGRWAWYKAETAWTKAEKDIPLKDQIGMLEKDLQVLDDTTLPAKVAELADARRENARLSQQVAEMEKAQQKWHDTLTTRLTEVKKANGQVAFNGRMVPVADALTALDRESKEWERSQDAMIKLREARDVAAQQADAVRDEGRALLAKRNELAARIQALKIKLKNLKMQELKSRRPVGNSEAAQLESRVAEAEGLLESREAEPKARAEIFGTQTTVPAGPVPSADSIEARLKVGQPSTAAPATPKGE